MDASFNSSKPSYEALEEQVARLSAKLEAVVAYHEEVKIKETIFQDIVDAVPAFIFWKDSNNNLLGFNKAYQQFVNIPRSELLSKTGFDLFPDAEKYWIDDKEVILTGKPKLNIVEEVVIPPGKSIWFKTDKVPLWDKSGKPFGVIGVSIDITHIKETQAKLERSLAENKKHSEYKDKLLSVIAHDLKNPVFNTDMILQLILLQESVLPKERIIEKIKKARNSTRNTLKLLTDLLEWSKAQFKAVAFEPVKLKLYDELEKLLPVLDDQLSAKEVRLGMAVPGDLAVHADQQMLQAILRNLITNAIKFSEQGGMVTVSTRIIKDRVCISVTDTGIGIKPEILRQLRSGNEEHMTTFGTKGEKGSGIGLSLTREFVRQHGGHLAIESEEGKGSSFSFSLPLAH